MKYLRVWMTVVLAAFALNACALYNDLSDEDKAKLKEKVKDAIDDAKDDSDGDGDSDGANTPSSESITVIYDWPDTQPNPLSFDGYLLLGVEDNLLRVPFWRESPRPVMPTPEAVIPESDDGVGNTE